MKYFFIKTILIITALLPLKTVHFLGKIIGKLTWITNSRIRKIAQRNIQLCFPELNSEQQKELVKKILNETGKLILETGKMWQLKSEKILSLIKDCEGEHLIKQAQAEGRGVIIASPHYGSWELIGLYCPKYYDMTIMYAPQSDPVVDNIMRQSRERNGAKLVPTDIKGIRAMSKALKQTELIGILPDQSPHSNGLFMPFFGHLCYTMTLLPKLAKKTNAVVLYAYAKRLEDSSGFKIIFRESSKDLVTLDIEEATIQMNLDIEKLIRETPHQYQWTYKRFKRRPEGEKSIY